MEGSGTSPLSASGSRRAVLTVGIAPISAELYGCSGSHQSSLVGAISARRPRYITAVRAATWRTVARRLRLLPAGATIVNPYSASTVESENVALADIFCDNLRRWLDSQPPHGWADDAKP